MTGIRTASLHFADVLQVAFRADRLYQMSGKWTGGFGADSSAADNEAIEFVALEVDLLFEERVQHDRRCAGIFHTPDVADVLAHRRGRGNQRILQLQPQVASWKGQSSCGRSIIVFASVVRRFTVWLRHVFVELPRRPHLSCASFSSVLACFGIALTQHGVAGLVVDVLLQRDRCGA